MPVISWPSLVFSFYSSQYPTQGLQTPTFRVGLPCFSKSLWKCLHRHTQGCASLVPKLFLHLIKLTIRVKWKKKAKSTDPAPGLAAWKWGFVTNVRRDGNHWGETSNMEDTCLIILTGFSFNAGQGLAQQKWRGGGDKECDRLYTQHI